MTTQFNPQRQTYIKYDDSHYLLFLNEQAAEQEDEFSGKISGYTYTGTMPDGSTLIEATGVNKENIRGKFIAGILGLDYSIDDQIALLANGEDSDEHSEELAAFHRARREAKKAVDELLSRTKIGCKP